MRLFVFGVGFSVEAYLHAHARDWDSVAGTVRSSAKAARLASQIPGFQPLVFDGDHADPLLEARLAGADALLVSVPPGRGDPVLQRYARTIAASHVRAIVYLSTIGVYGGDDGGWVDETTAPAPVVARGMARVEAENGWLALGAPDRKVFVLRLAGIYGPGRNALVNLREGEAKRIVRPGQVFNRIHVADIAQAIAACFATDSAGGVVNVCDDEPAPPQDVVTFAAGLLGVAPPPEVPFEQAELSPMARSFWASNKRVSNRKLRTQLRVELRYPSYREGLAALAVELR